VSIKFTPAYETLCMLVTIYRSVVVAGLRQCYQFLEKSVSKPRIASILAVHAALVLYLLAVRAMGTTHRPVIPTP